MAATLFHDDFSGPALDETVWRLPTGTGTLFGRTQIKPPEYNGQNLRPVVSNGKVTLRLDTYNASALTPGDTFWGHEIQTRETFLPGPGGISVETRMRYIGTPPGGLVAGFFTWGYDGAIRDEIDVEVLSNDLTTERFVTNVYNDATFTNSPGFPATVQVPGFDMTEWNTYEIVWLPDRIQWNLNGSQVRELMIDVDGHPSEVRLNFWAPDDRWGAAYNQQLQPVTTQALNRQYLLEIDYVQVSSVPVPAAAWLFLGGLVMLATKGFRYGRQSFKRMD